MKGNYTNLTENFQIRENIFQEIYKECTNKCIYTQSSSLMEQFNLKF